MSAFDDAPLVEPASREAWRAWLEGNHRSAAGVWFVSPRAVREQRVGYEAAVEEALCFGWVDGRAGNVDAARSKLYFSPRRPGSGWAATNKARVERLLAAGRMAPAGLAAIERARADGSWTLLDAAERLEAPDDLARALDTDAAARRHWDAFPPSTRKMAIAWVATARRPDTRARRVEQIVTRAQRGQRPPL